MRKLLLIFATVAMFASCSGEDTTKKAEAAKPAAATAKAKSQPKKPAQAPVNPKQAQEDDKKIQEYLAKNNLKAEKTAEGVYYNITGKGDGANPTRGVTTQRHGKAKRACSRSHVQHTHLETRSRHCVGSWPVPPRQGSTLLPCAHPTPRQGSSRPSSRRRDRPTRKCKHPGVSCRH